MEHVIHNHCISENIQGVIGSVSLTECNSGTVQKFYPFGVRATIELYSITNTL